MDHAKKKIREKIEEIAGRRRNVTLRDIEWVVNRLSEFHEASVRDSDSGNVKLFRVGGTKPFPICTHNPGSKQIKPVYVDVFLDRMAELGWYDE
jgi:hypothetical protein